MLTRTASRFEQLERELHGAGRRLGLESHHPRARQIEAEPEHPVVRADEVVAAGRDGEGPARRVTVDAFSIDRFAVTNAQFATFVDATGHVSEAERFGWSFVFAGLLPDDYSPTQGAAAMGGHDDQVRPDPGGLFHDLGSGGAFADIGPDRYAVRLLQ